MVAVSGWNEEKDRRHGRAAGFHHHFAKPVDIEALTALLAGPARGELTHARSGAPAGTAGTP